MNDLDAVLAFRAGERWTETRPRRCPECGQRCDHVDLIGDDEDGPIYLCRECLGREDMAQHVADGHNVVALVEFDGVACGALPYGWAYRTTYGSLLADGRILEGLPIREVRPETYERA